MENLIQELKQKIVSVLMLNNISPEDIREDEPLFGGDLEIDSIDVLELVMMVEQDYGILIDNRELGEKVFRTVRTLAEYIDANTPES